ncbi:hypothetical protein B0H17DRAFT_1265323 [Mycena rosella]|uniref:Uncharacterized protein n=1 Tax=Mycena rosella TaxID=1033263 RepID=A0AAD7CRM8_MYCRO|nr:hypothetical protein B0H17DRAFT_1265323 [Mycena rosella]
MIFVCDGKICPKRDCFSHKRVKILVFTAADPTKDIEEILGFLALPMLAILDDMLTMLSQAWFNSRKSMHTWLNPEIAPPFWVLTYWGEMLNACEAEATWLRADAWVNRTGKGEGEAAIKLTVRALWNVLRWHGNLPGGDGRNGWMVSREPEIPRYRSAKDRMRWSWTKAWMMTKLEALAKHGHTKLR